MNEKKLVEAFKAFFEKSVIPSINENNSLLSEWKHFNGMISADPIDYQQVEFYLLMLNKSNPSFTKQPVQNYQDNKQPYGKYNDPQPIRRQ